MFRLSSIALCIGVYTAIALKLAWWWKLLIALAIEAMKG